MTTWYVATLACYVLVEAEDENEAREKGRPALADLYREQLGREAPIDIRTVRPATEDEVKLVRWHHEMVARER